MTELSVVAAKAAAPFPSPSIKTRPATPDDDAWVEHLQALAFGPGRFARAAFRVRERLPIDTSLSRIAEIGGARVSSVWMTPISVGGINGYLLGPLATDPAFRNLGAGKALVREVTHLALMRGDGDFVLLVGDPPYYGPLGFVPTRSGAIVFPGPVDPARVLVHSADSTLAARLEGEVASFIGDRTEGARHWASGGSLFAGIRQRLMPVPEVIDDKLDLEPDWLPDVPHAHSPIPAAVLIALVERDEGFTLLYTERSSKLRAHSGQVAFPGGKLDPQDKGPAEAALREAWEEVRLLPEDAEILGYLPTYFTGTNYLITPVVAAVRPRAPFVPDPGEVSDLFEVPLALIARAENYSTYKIARRGVTHSTWQVLYNGHIIWGITGNLTRRFFELALAEATA